MRIARRGRNSLGGSLIRGTIGVLLGFSLAAARPVTSESAKDSPIPQRLKAIWDGFGSDVVTMHVMCRTIRRSSSTGLPRESVNSVLAQIDIANDEAASAKLSEAFGFGLDSTNCHWGLLEVWSDGGKLRHDERYDGTLIESLTCDGDQEVVIRGFAHQIDIYPRGGSVEAKYPVEYFRFIPRVASNADVKAFEATSADKISVRANGRDYLVDEATGFVHSASWGDPNKTFQEHLFLQPVLYPGDILFPRAVIQAQYVGGRLSSMFITVVDKAEFN